MLFKTRALLCIGTITVLAIQRLPSEPKLPPVSSLVGPAAALVGDACRAKPELCAAALTRGLDGVPRPVVPDRAVAPVRAKPTRGSADRATPVALGVRSLT